MNDKKIKMLQETNQRRSSLHIDIENITENPLENKSKDNDIETGITNPNIDEDY